jgi:hypothetical protein
MLPNLLSPNYCPTRQTTAGGLEAICIGIGTVEEEEEKEENEMEVVGVEEERSGRHSSTHFDFYRPKRSPSRPASLLA